MIEIPRGWRSSAPVPKAKASGRAPSRAASVVITMGRNRSRQAAWIASRGVRPCRRSSSRAKSTIMMAFFFTIPISSRMPMMAMMERSSFAICNASSAPSPAEGKVDRMVMGCVRLSYSTPSTI